MNCIKCGADITPTAKFCLECGATQTSQPLDAAAPSVPSEVPSPPESAAEKAMPKTRRIPLPLLVLGGLIVVVVLIMILRDSKSPQPNRSAFAEEQNDAEGYEGRQWGSQPVGDVGKNLGSDQMDILGFIFGVPIKREIVVGANLGERLDTQSLPTFTSESNNSVTYIYQNNVLCAVLVHADAHNYDNVRATIEGKGYSHIAESSVQYRRLGDSSDGDSTKLESILYKRGSTNTRVYLMKYINHSPVFDSWDAYLLYIPNHYYNAIVAEIKTGVRPSPDSTTAQPSSSEASTATAGASASPLPDTEARNRTRSTNNGEYDLGKTLTLFGFRTREDQSSAMQLAHSAGFDEDTCPDSQKDQGWMIRVRAHNACFRKGEDGELVLYMIEGTVNTVTYEFPIDRFERVRSKLIRQYGNPTFANAADKMEMWVDKKRLVTLSIAKRTDGTTADVKLYEMAN